jgi:environmental stress-induced protein Ves
MVIEGKGMVLSVAGRPPRRLDKSFVPYEFSGDAATICELIDGPIRDFNLMVNRALVSARLQVRELSREESVLLAEEILVFHLLSGGAELLLGSTQQRADAGDTIILGSRAATSNVTLRPQQRSTVAVINLKALR